MQKSSIGQSALEVLLLIGGAILVTLLVISLLSSVSTPVGQSATQNTALALCKTGGCTGQVELNNEIFDCQAILNECTAEPAVNNSCTSTGGTCNASCTGTDIPYSAGDSECNPNICCQPDSDNDGVADYFDSCLTESCLALFRCTAQDLETCTVGGNGCDTWLVNQTCAVNETCSISPPGCESALPNCSDSMLNNSETDVDCGGPNCGPCSFGSTCLANSDCLSNICYNNFCDNDSDSDGVYNSVDQCDGIPNPIENCAVNFQCTGQDLEECTTNILDGCDAWSLNQTCSLSEVCSVSPPGCETIPVSCTDLTQNGNETDVDCGGLDCPQCVLGQSCTINSDCVSGLCSAGICAPDVDGDGIEDSLDNCPITSNAAQLNSDIDLLGDACDNCDLIDNQDQNDFDGDGTGDLCDSEVLLTSCTSSFTANTTYYVAAPLSSVPTCITVSSLAPNVTIDCLSNTTNSIESQSNVIAINAGGTIIKNCTISSPMFISGQVGVQLNSTADNSKILNNVFTVPDEGVYLVGGADGVEVSDNNITARTGIRIASANNQILNNVISASVNGIRVNSLPTATNNTLIGNNVCGGSLKRITIAYSDPQNAASTNNTCGLGLCVHGSAVPSSNVCIDLDLDTQRDDCQNMC